MPVEEMEILGISLLFILPTVLISISYIMLRVNLKLLKGSVTAYWVLLIYFALQCIGFGVAGTKFNFDLGGIPITFTFTVDDFFLKINIVAIILTGYLYSLKNQLPELLEKLKTQKY
ncbi:hypothetical protein LB465_01800 [Salegentibacter sp. LM13S]|uniref:hypothetical protein n=1 Tax=Salegentibacter lacus TaxID=2873599 RepID=UPI001CC98387|nr:hypothetical protein [Salegentibacter lacus]MBZ9629497.1 hypothetical protein [Salegentibacter lacus]